MFFDSSEHLRFCHGEEEVENLGLRNCDHAASLQSSAERSYGRCQGFFFSKHTSFFDIFLPKKQTKLPQVAGGLFDWQNLGASSLHLAPEHSHPGAASRALSPGWSIDVAASESEELGEGIRFFFGERILLKENLTQVGHHELAFLSGTQVSSSYFIVWLRIFGWAS